VSVTGEFRRLVADCIAFLEGLDAHGAQQRADALRIAFALAPNDLSGAAERVRAIAEDPARHPPIEFSTTAEGDEYAHLEAHTLAIVDSLLGKSER